MLNQDQIHAAVQRLVVQLSQPARVILFGSYARDQANADSDLDLLIVERSLPDKPAEYLKLKQAIGRLGVGIDLLLMSAGEFERRRQVPGTLAYWASKEGRIIYESLH
ncbi:MAG: nucleotidyltransferase domain-containing protein [Lamprobacter sp.]|uniref:nucleotidyltransferase domain-containing protein n=1 Tax=Lamprobacter sp. TaxID=3100796 RepID=UPI002B25C227|nr:nucleotidyltransferase domain-containing protein [Lamprobacter sp.]MEA3639695.1 nucleotidyltransferase domain-containing protein [Lamprobacter sp.]